MISLRQSAPFSLSTLVLFFILLGTSLYGALGGLIFDRMETVRDEIQRKNVQSARKELSTAVQELLTRARVAAQELARWDEANQQLFDPEFYPYWKENRMRSHRRFSEFIVAAELYDKNGRALSGKVMKPMPPSIAAQDLGLFLKQISGRDYLFAVETAPSWQPNGSFPGYAMISLDFRAALLVTNQFRYVNPATLDVDLRDNQRLAAAEILPNLKFSPTPNPEGEALKTLMVNHIVRVAGLAAVLWLLLYLLLVVFVATPLQKLSRYIDHLRGVGSATSLVSPLIGNMWIKELEKVRQSLNDYQSRLEEVHDSLDRKNRELWEMAHHDPLTGSLNRRAFDDDCKRIFAITEGQRVDVSLVLIDCDHFKAINDTYGHDIGDRVLRTIASTVQQTLRKGDRLYRLGGDEFAVLFLDKGQDHPETAAWRLLESVDRYDYAKLGIREPVRISIGVAHAMGTDVGALKALYRHADVAMYHAKRPGGRNIIVYHDALLDDNTHSLLSNRVAHGVYEAIDSGKYLEMHYQPIVALPQQTVAFFEALARVRIGQSLLMPESILPVVERRHVEAKFDSAVLDCILKDLESGMLPAGVGVTINLAGASIIDARILDKLWTFKPYLETHRFLLEVTETSVITQLQLASERLDRLRRQGFLVALDDFGSGYSSLRYLANMPVDIVKFDISLIHTLCNQSAEAEMMKQLVSLIRRPGYELIAEGIETEEMLSYVTELDFSYAQGNLLGRPEPLPFSELTSNLG